jgi:hypothetical protein
MFLLILLILLFLDAMWRGIIVSRLRNQYTANLYSILFDMREFGYRNRIYNKKGFLWYKGIIEKLIKESSDIGIFNLVLYSMYINRLRKKNVLQPHPTKEILIRRNTSDLTDWQRSELTILFDESFNKTTEYLVKSSFIMLLVTILLNGLNYIAKIYHGGKSIPRTLTGKIEDRLNETEELGILLAAWK